MTLHLSSSAPHLYPVAGWKADTVQYLDEAQRPPRETKVVLYENASDAVEVGIHRREAGVSRIALANHALHYFFLGNAFLRGLGGEKIEVVPGTLVHFKTGWAGECEVVEPLESTYMVCSGASDATATVLSNPLTTSPLNDWDVIPTMLEGSSRTAGVLLSRDADRRAESGVWTCSPGTWRCTVTSDEYCHFLDGECTYVHESGDVIEVRPDTLAFFPQGWTGRCIVRATVRKVYLIR